MKPTLETIKEHLTCKVPCWEILCARWFGTRILGDKYIFYLWRNAVYVVKRD